MTEMTLKQAGRLAAEEMVGILKRIGVEQTWAVAAVIAAFNEADQCLSGPDFRGAMDWLECEA